MIEGPEVGGFWPWNGWVLWASFPLHKEYYRENVSPGQPSAGRLKGGRRKVFGAGSAR